MAHAAIRVLYYNLLVPRAGGRVLIALSRVDAVDIHLLAEILQVSKWKRENLGLPSEQARRKAAVGSWHGLTSTCLISSTLIPWMTAGRPWSKVGMAYKMTMVRPVLHLEIFEKKCKNW